MMVAAGAAAATGTRAGTGSGCRRFGSGLCGKYGKFLRQLLRTAMRAGDGAFPVARARERLEIRFAFRADKFVKRHVSFLVHGSRFAVQGCSPHDPTTQIIARLTEARLHRNGRAAARPYHYCSVNLHCKGIWQQRAGPARPINPDGVRAGDRFGWGQPTLHRNAEARPSEC